MHAFFWCHQCGAMQTLSCPVENSRLSTQQRSAAHPIDERIFKFSQPPKTATRFLTFILYQNDRKGLIHPVSYDWASSSHQLYVLNVGIGAIVVWTEIMIAEWKESDVIYRDHAQSLAKCINIAIWQIRRRKIHLHLYCYTCTHIIISWILLH